MEVNSAFSSAISGIATGMQGLERNADTIIKASAGSGADVAEPLLESRLDVQQVAVNAKVIGTLDETLGSLLDVMA